MTDLIRMDDPQPVQPPKAPFLPRAVASALTSSGAYVVGQGLRWTSESAVQMIGEHDRANLPAMLDTLNASMRSDTEWLANRLTVLWLSVGYRRGDTEAAAWLSETVRLLAHIPTDILSTSIDEAVRKSQRGFLPAVGEILAIAEPLAEKRRIAIDRLRMMSEYRGLPRKSSDNEPRCTPAQADAIRKEFNLKTPDEAASDRRYERGKLGPPRKPTRQGYIDLGMTPEQCDAAGVP